MSGHLLGIAAAAAIAVAGFARKGSLSTPSTVTNEELAAALRAYRPLVGSAAKRDVAEISPQDFPGQERLPGFSDDDLVRLGLARKKDDVQPAKGKRSRKKLADLDAEVERSAGQTLDDELSALAGLELEKGAAAALHEQKRRVKTQAPKRRPRIDPVSEGPWELFLRSNPSDVSDQILVALLLADGTGDPMERARILLEKSMGSIGQLIEGSFGADEDVPESTRARLIAAAELSRRAELRQMFSVKNKVAINNPDAAASFVRRMSRGPQEKMSAIYIGSSGYVIGYRSISIGSSKFVLIDAAEVFRPAVVLRASSVIMAHQHPSGDPEPSNDDIRVTRNLIEAGRSLQIPLSDHIIVGDNSYTSIRQRGLANFN